MKINRSTQQGVMLLEALIGILIFSIGILALIAMQSVAISQVRDAQYRTDASMLAERMMGDLYILRDTTATGASTKITQWQTDIANTLPAGTGAVVQNTTALGKEVTITVAWQAPAASAASSHVSIGLLKYND